MLSSVKRTVAQKKRVPGCYVLQGKKIKKEKDKRGIQKKLKKHKIEPIKLEIRN